MSSIREPDLITEVEEQIELLNKVNWSYYESIRGVVVPVPDLLRRLVEDVKRQRGLSTDAVIQKIQIMQEKHPGQRIDLSVDPDGYCYVTRSDRNGNTQPIAEGATMGDVFEE